MHCQGGLGCGEDYIRFFTFLGTLYRPGQDKKTKKLFEGGGKIGSGTFMRLDLVGH